MNLVKDRLEKIVDLIVDALIENGIILYESEFVTNVCRQIALDSYRVIINNPTIEEGDDDRAIISMDPETAKLFLRQIVIEKSKKEFYESRHEM